MKISEFTRRNVGALCVSGLSRTIGGEDVVPHFSLPQHFLFSATPRLRVKQKGSNS